MKFFLFFLAKQIKLANKHIEAPWISFDVTAPYSTKKIFSLDFEIKISV